MSRLPFSRTILVTSACAALLSASCSDSAATGPGTASSPDSSAPSVYVPYVSDFCNYTSWTKYVEPDAGGDGVITPSALTDGGFIHNGGGRTEYINHVPPHGSTSFPQRTLIVKTIPAQGQVFAMAKVGGGYNPNLPDGGALNWEWFELGAGDCPVDFIWSGSEPPANQSYGGTPQACNDCHGGYPENDYVASPKILLQNY